MAKQSDCNFCTPQCAAVALGRWCIGLIFLVFGATKFPHYSDFARNLVTQYEKTWLPAWVVGGFGHVLPFLEVGFGVLLILGIYRSAVLFLTGLLLIVLMFGQAVVAQGQVVFMNTAYLFITATLLFLARHDRWVIFPRPKSERSGPTSEKELNAPAQHSRT